MFQGYQKALVAGMARSGIAMVKALSALDVDIAIYDAKREEDFGEALAELEHQKVEKRLGVSVDQALSGVDLLIISPGIPIDSPLVQAALRLSVDVIGELELGFLLTRGTSLAITGTNGKTTTTALCGEIFKNMGKNTFVVGNIGLPITESALSSRDDDVTVIEVSSFQLESIRTFRPHVAAILNITEDHLNRHGTMENYIAVKKRVNENQREEDFLVLNWDDALTRALKAGANGSVAYFSRKEVLPFGCYVVGDDILYNDGKTVKKICGTQDVFIPGAHNLENALAAALIAALCGVPTSVIRHTLRTFKGVEHRIETVATVDGVTYINDSKGTNVDASIKAVEAMTVPTVLLAGGYDKHADFAPLAKAIAASQVRRVVVLGETRRQIKEALRAEQFPGILECDGNFAQAFQMAKDAAEPGQNVLLSPACASFDMFSDFEQRGRVFKELVRGLRA